MPLEVKIVVTLGGSIAGCDLEGLGEGIQEFHNLFLDQGAGTLVHFENSSSYIYITCVLLCCVYYTSTKHFRHCLHIDNIFSKSFSWRVYLLPCLLVV